MKTKAFGYIVDSVLICPKCAKHDDKSEPVDQYEYPDGYTCGDCGLVFGYWPPSVPMFPR